MKLEIRKIPASDWVELSEHAHLAVFGKKKPASFDRIDYALLLVDEANTPHAYLTAREQDHESVYWQFGGAFPPLAKNFHAFFSYLQLIQWEREAGRKRIATAIENTNQAYLKMAMKAGFLIVGVRHYNGTTLLELVLEFNGG